MTSAAQNSKQILAPKGTAGTPSHSFLGGNTTGMYLIGTNGLGIATNGVVAVTYDSSQNASFAASVTIIAGSINGTAIGASTPSTGTFSTLVGTHNAYGNIIALTDAATIAVDMSVTGGNNFSVTLGGNRTLGNPTGLTAGQSGVIYITQDGTGGRTLAYGSYWKFPGGTAPTLTTTASATDALVYTVRNSTSITVTSILNIG